MSTFRALAALCAIVIATDLFICFGLDAIGEVASAAVGALIFGV